MSNVVKLPELGEDVSEGRVVKVLVQKGDSIETEQPLLEVESDKATVEIPAPRSGKVSEVLVSEGDEIHVGDDLVRLEGNGKEDGAQKKPKQRGSEGKKETKDTEDTKESKSRKKPEPKKKQSAESEEEEDTKTGGSSPSREPTRRDETRSSEESEPSRPDRADRADRSIDVPAAPSVRRFAREVGVALENVEGSGPGGRISMADVKRAAREATSRSEPLPEPSEEDESHALGTIRTRIAERMTHSWRTIPQVTVFAEAGVREAWRALERFANEAEEDVPRTALFAKVAAVALQLHPRLNASLDLENHRLLVHHRIHIGVAVDTPHGLLVPVLRDADRKNLVDLGEELRELAGKARERKLRPEHLRGATFTITNLGGSNVTHFTPIIDPPQVAILGVGRARKDGVVPLSLTFDHRALDGAEAARFLTWLGRCLQDPWTAFIEG